MRTYITQEQKQLGQLRERIIGRRKTLGITQDQLAKEIGKARNTYSEMEKDIGKAHLEDILTIIHVLGLESDISDIVRKR